jgi:hypothetical protein
MINIVMKVITTTDNKPLTDINNKTEDTIESLIIEIQDKGKVDLEIPATIIEGNTINATNRASIRKTASEKSPLNT